MELNREKIIHSLMHFGQVEVCSIGSHFALLITDKETKGLESLATYNNIYEALKHHGVIEVYKNLQVVKNEPEFFMLTINK